MEENNNNNNNNNQGFNLGNSLKGQRKKEYQKKREDLLKKLDEAYKVLKNIVEELDEIDFQEQSDNAVLENVLGMLRK